MNEWEFTAEVAGWINSILEKDASLPFSRARVEQRGQGSRKRRDLTLLDKDKRAALTGEIKLPYQPDGSSPYNHDVVQDARAKAKRAGSPFFFTWNVNEFVLWETTSDEPTWQGQNYKSWDVTSIHKESHLELSPTFHAIQTWLTAFLPEYAQIYLRTTPLGTVPPDEKFIQVLESSLHLPIRLTIDELHEKYQKPKFRKDLDAWMRNEQGWIIHHDLEGIRDNLERAAKFSCYALVNKLVFHEALLKRYRPKMVNLHIHDHIDTGEKFRLHLEGYFAEAITVTGDYETVFGEEHSSIGSRIPTYSDSAVSHWRALINQIHKFDFSNLDYDIIGTIFERLIAPNERHKYGQFYTRVEVVDLVNSFCIRQGDEKVMDPACGGGTFLVRAYSRKRELMPARTHGERLTDLFGVDFSHFATHLTTINLATRDLIDDENYPQIARSDFFDVETGKTFTRLPRHISASGLGKAQQRKVEIPLLDAVIGNPPYIRQEDIPKVKKKGKGGGIPHGTKEYYQALIKRETNARLSGRSDIHCYFWPHATSFLKEDGYLCLLTSSQWLDVEYGFRLQDWILRNFRIVAILESIDEPWFVGARVTTTITILRRENDEKERMQNTVKFVQLRRPIRDILEHDNTMAGALEVADRFRDEILNLTQNTVNERYRARLVRQGGLWNDGVRLGLIMGKSTDPPNSDTSRQGGTYYGGKWGVYLRAPDLWFELMDKYGSKFSPLGDVAEVRRGITTGNDSFFYTIDASEECLDSHPDPMDFQMVYGLPRDEVASGRIKLVRAGEGHGEIHPIEAKYLEPEVHSLMEIESFTVKPKDCSRIILLVGKKRKALKGTYVLKYIQWGEKKGYHKGSTTAARVTKDKEWYDLTGHRRAPALWPKERQYRHIAPANQVQLIANCRLYEIYPPPEYYDSDFWGGLLNSSWTILSSFQYGRPVGNEGNWSTMVVDANIMHVPDPRKATKSSLDRIAKSFREISKRNPMFFLSERRLRAMAYMQKGKEEKLASLSNESELDMADRQALDDAVLEMIGIDDPKRREELIDQLYHYLRQFFEWTRQKEEKAILNKKKAKRRGLASPSEIAVQVYEEILEKHVHLLKQYDPDFLDRSKPFDTFDLPHEGAPGHHTDLFTAHGVQFIKGKGKQVAVIPTKHPAQNNLIVLLAESGTRGLVRIPHDESECKRVYEVYQSFIRKRDKKIFEIIEERTADEEMQEKIYEALMPLVVGIYRGE